MRFHDLVKEGFDPRLTAAEARGQASANPLVRTHISELRDSDLLVVERMWRDCILTYCGIGHVSRSLFGVAANSSDEERRGWLGQAASIAGKAVELATRP